MQLTKFKNKLGKLRVAANRRYLEYDDGTPFFYLGDTAYDPRYGCTYYIHATTNVSFQTYAPPTSGRGNDWILILEEE
jgi:hypothetical protein